MKTLIDTHAHLYAEQFAADQHDMIDRAIEVGVEKMYLPNIDLDSIDGMHSICEQYSENLFPMMGLHPCSVHADFHDVLDKMETYFEVNKYYGVGETGIDLHWDQSTEVWQMESFERQIEWAKKYKLPIVIHSRAALDKTIALIKKHKDENLRGIFHCFDGTDSQAHEIIQMGFYMGIGGVVTYKKSHLPELIKSIGLKHMVLETDAPYLSPMPKRGKRNESSHLKYIAEFIANLVNQDVESVTELTSNNAREIFM